MRSFKEEQIGALAPGANALANARKISSGGGFISRLRSEDDTFYMGICKGSGKSDYVVSADFVDEENPVFRCNCPSRQFPCKHSLALLFEIAAGKEFTVGDIPEDIRKKREKKEAREAKKASAAEEKPKNPRAGKAARTKKIQKQLEGLELLRQAVSGLLNTGLSSMGSISLKSYRELAKQLGDYYLPGPQAGLNRLILEVEAFQKDQDQSHYHRAVEVLKKLHGLEKKADVYLREKLKKEDPEVDGDVLYEELGGIWKLEQLNALGLKKENARLLQLSFQVIFDAAKKEYADTGWWADLDSGEIFCTCNYRPVRALKYIKQEDSCFDLVRIPCLLCYPGGMNRRVRWENAGYETTGPEHWNRLKELAWQEIRPAVKEAKNELKNTLSEDFCGMLLAFSRIGNAETEKGSCMVAEDRTGCRIELRNRPGEEDTLTALTCLAEPELLRNQALFGRVYYDPSDRSICMSPLSIVSDRGIVRFLF
ncbi:MAG: SWIM zinc finger family protein [Lachnospiraceae bacterium]|nr:SWIM zinc finger family protein [Lachnospiraceae bacterium]